MLTIAGLHLSPSEKAAYDLGYQAATQALIDHARELARNGVPADPHEEWRADWHSARDKWLAEGRNADLKTDGPHVAEMDRLTDLLCGTVAKTPTGLLVQIDFAGDLLKDGCTLHEDYPLLRSIRAGVEGLKA